MDILEFNEYEIVNAPKRDNLMGFALPMSN